MQDFLCFHASLHLCYPLNGPPLADLCKNSLSLQCHCIVSRLLAAMHGQNMTSLAAASRRGPRPLHHHQTMAKLDNPKQSSACCQKVFVLPPPKKNAYRESLGKNPA